MGPFPQQLLLSNTVLGSVAMHSSGFILGMLQAASGHIACLRHPLFLPGVCMCHAGRLYTALIGFIQSSREQTTPVCTVKVINAVALGSPQPPLRAPQPPLPPPSQASGRRQQQGGGRPCRAAQQLGPSQAAGHSGHTIEALGLGDAPDEALG